MDFGTEIRGCRTRSDRCGVLRTVIRTTEVEVTDCDWNDGASYFRDTGEAAHREGLTPPRTLTFLSRFVVALRALLAILVSRTAWRTTVGPPARAEIEQFTNVCQ